MVVKNHVSNPPVLTKETHSTRVARRRHIEVMFWFAIGAAGCSPVSNDPCDFDLVNFTIELTSAIESPETRFEVTGPCTWTRELSPGANRFHFNFTVRTAATCTLLIKGVNGEPLWTGSFRLVPTRCEDRFVTVPRGLVIDLPRSDGGVDSPDAATDASQ